MTTAAPIEARIVRVGNALYVNIPADIARERGLREGQTVRFDPEPMPNRLGDLIDRFNALGLKSVVLDPTWTDEQEA